MNGVNYLKLSSKLAQNKGNWRGGETKIGDFPKLGREGVIFWESSVKVIQNSMFFPTLCRNE